MLKCPKCGNTKTFVCDIKGVGIYVQEHDSFVEVGDFDFPETGGIVSCRECRHNAERSEFEVEDEE